MRNLISVDRLSPVGGLSSPTSLSAFMAETTSLPAQSRTFKPLAYEKFAFHGLGIVGEGVIR
jgi:hypothetical protein